MKEVLITAFIGSRNLGDEAIFRTILHNISHDRDAITALSINEAKTKKLGVKTIFAKRIGNIRKGILQSDLVLIGGGGIIQDQSSILNFFYYALQLWLCRRYSKPTILCFVGVGPLRFRISRYVLSRLVGAVNYAIVRDEASRVQLLQAGMPTERIYQVHDPVLNYPVKKGASISPYRGSSPYVVLSMRRWFFTNPLLPVFVSRKINRIKFFRQRYDKYMDLLARDLDRFLKKHDEITLIAVSLYDGEDDVVSRDLTSRMEQAGRVVHADNNMDEEQYLAIAKGAQFVIGMRLHSLILAAAVGKPFVALRYSTKVDEFTAQMNLSQFSIHVEKYDSKSLQKALSEMTQHHERHSKNIKSALVKYKKENQEAFQILNNLIKELLGE